MLNTDNIIAFFYYFIKVWENKGFYPSIAIRTPAATAEPITPATFGPIACIRRKLAGLACWPTFCETRADVYKRQSLY